MHLFFEAKNGEPTLRFRDTLIHSSYDPGREARRFAQRVPPATCYLILGGGLGHLAAALNEARRDSLILTVHPSAELAKTAAAAPGGHVSPESRRELSAAMARTFGAEGRYGFKLLPWEPAARAAPDWFERQQGWALSLAKEWHDSLLSTGYFGFSWLRNALRNLRGSRPKPPPSLPLESQPVLAAPGPTLDRCLDWLRREREGLFLVSVSSAWTPLKRRGIEADLIVHTDGSHWATHHLRPLPAGTPASPIPLAAPLRAAFPAGGEKSLSLLLTDPTSPVERALLGATSLPALPLPGHGTVSGTAVRLIRLLTEAPPVILGLDLAVEGARSHARGHAFEPLLQTMSHRTHPLATILTERLGESAPLDPPWRQPRDLAVYAASLAAELCGSPGGCLRLHPSPVDLCCTGISEKWTARGRNSGESRARRDPWSSLLPPPEAPLSPPELLEAWRALLRDAGSEHFLSLRREPGGVTEELAQFLALPELLRLRRSRAEEGDTQGAMRILRERLLSRIEELIRKAER
jgi:hypothetical protein